MITGWHVAIYRSRICWIALARRTPFPRGELMPGPGGRFAFGQSRDEALANLRDEVAR
jgi:hypothetical protein